MYTELEAINFILSHVGAAPVTDLGVGLPDIQSAQLRLNEANIWMQKRGWWFNRLIDVTFEPDPADENRITLPPNTLKIISSYPEFIIERLGYAYSPLSGTDEFFTHIQADIVLKLEWIELPGSAQDCAMHRAAQQMILHDLEDHNKAALLAEDIQAAYALLKAEDLEVHQRNTYSTPAIQRALRRVRPYKRRSHAINPVYPGGRA